jgi:hypothetical protein
MNGKLHALNTLPQEKEPLVPVEWNAGWATEPVWTLWRREEMFVSGWQSNPGFFIPYSSDCTGHSHEC